MTLVHSLVRSAGGDHFQGLPSGLFYGKSLVHGSENKQGRFLGDCVYLSLLYFLGLEKHYRMDPSPTSLAVGGTHAGLPSVT